MTKKSGVMEHPLEDLLLLLATGQGRSGTTVLTKALAEHEHVFSNRVESNVMRDVLEAGQRSVSIPSRLKQMVVSRKEHDLVFRRMLLHLLFPVTGQSPEPRPLALSTFSGMSSQIAEYMTAVFPKVHFANIVRNGIEVVASRMVHRTLRDHTFKEHCGAWAAAADMAKWGVDRDDFTLLRHEDLRLESRREQIFENLLKRAGLPHDPGCARYVARTTQNQTRYLQESAEVHADFERRADRWQFWSDEQRDTFVERCGETMAYFGYSIPWET